MVWSYLKSLLHYQDNSAGDSKMDKKERKMWEENIKDWTDLKFGESIRAVEDGAGWRSIVETSTTNKVKKD